MKILSIPIPEDKIQQFCQQWQITELCLFGSILRDDFTPDSDIDILVTFSPETQWSLLDFIKMEYQLQNILNRKVDLVIKETIENSDNWLRKQSILETAERIYGA